MRPVKGGICPPKISRTTQRSNKRQTALDSPWRELSKACNFVENRGHRAGQTEAKDQILFFFTMAPTEAKQSIINVFFLSERSLDSHNKVLKCPWDGPKQRSGQGQVAKGQLSNMKKHGHAAHVLGHLAKRNSLVIV